MLTDNKLQISASTIGRANLATSVTTASANIKYSYASDDNRIFKSVTQIESINAVQKEWYLRTGGGIDIGIFNISNNQFNWYVFGAERVAKVNHIPTLTFTTAAGEIGGNSYTSDPFIIPLTIGANMPAPIADYYVYDHLGNTRVIYGVQLSCSNGTPTYQLRYAADYYPFGKVLREWTTTTPEKYLYTQHERDKETGLDYALARFYDSGLGRFTGVDPLASKYPGYSPYCYGLNNPIRMVDRDGRKPEDIIYLFFKNAPFGYSISGHSAVLIGNDKSGYQYFNITGNTNSNGNAELYKNSFKSLSEFNTKINGGDGSSYEIGYRVETTQEQDEKMLQKAVEGDSKPYEIKGNNCADFVRNVGDAGDVENGTKKDVFGITWPKSEFKEFINSNPGGTFEFFGDKSFKEFKRQGFEFGKYKIHLNYDSSYKRNYTVTDDSKDF